MTKYGETGEALTKAFSNLVEEATRLGDANRKIVPLALRISDAISEIQSTALALLASVASKLPGEVRVELERLPGSVTMTIYRGDVCVGSVEHTSVVGENIVGGIRYSIASSAVSYPRPSTKASVAS